MNRVKLEQLGSQFTSFQLLGKESFNKTVKITKDIFQNHSFAIAATASSLAFFTGICIYIYKNKKECFAELFKRRHTPSPTQEQKKPRKSVEIEIEVLEREEGVRDNEFVSQDALKTREGRENYYKYLTSKPNLSPLEKLYGPQFAEIKSLKAVLKRAKVLSIPVHPDRAPKEEKEVCEELFKRIQQAKWECKIEIRMRNRRNFGPFGKVDVSEMESRQAIATLIGSGRIGKAIEYVERLSEEEIREDPDLAFVICRALLYVGKLEEAVNILPEKYKYAKEIFRHFQELIKYSKEHPEQKEQIEAKLLELIQNLESIPTHYKGISTNLRESYFSFTLPHNVYMALKDVYKYNGDLLNYEVNLRKAIRNCVSASEDKKALIEELKEHLREYGIDAENMTHTDSLRREEGLDLVLEQLTKELEESEFIGLGENYDIKEVANWLRKFKETREISCLEDAVRTIKKIEEMPRFFMTVRGYGYKWTEKQRTYLERRSKAIQGLKILYDKKERFSGGIAWTKFAEVECFLGMAIVDVEKRFFQSAIESLGEALEEGKEPAEEKWILEEIVRIMNYCDGLYLAEGSLYKPLVLKEIDELQLRAIREMHRLNKQEQN